jgi:predicted lipoprotein
VDNEEENKKEGKLDIYFVDDTFKADDYVAGIWKSKVLPLFEEKSVDLATLLSTYRENQEETGSKFGYREKAEGSPWNFKVKGVGKILKARTKSRAATMEIDLEPQDGSRDAIIQIGPVIKGTSIRDSLDFVTFGMFTNQIEFAQLANALNKRTYKDVLSTVDRATIVGKTVRFTGAFTQVPYSSKILITPVQLEVN